MHLFNLKVEPNIPSTDPPYYFYIVLSSMPLAPGVRLKTKKRHLCPVSVSCAIEDLWISLPTLRDWTAVFKEVTTAAHIIKPFGSKCCEL